MKRFLLLHCLLFSFTTSNAISIIDYIKGMEKHSGFFDFYWDKNTGKILLEVKEFDKEFLYINSLQSGVGSNDIGLDRGQLGDRKLVKFQRFGNKVMLVQPNIEYRAISNNPMEVKAVEDGFAQSIILGSEIVAETNGAVLIDITDFLLRDSHNISGRLARMKQGNFKADSSRSTLFMENTKSFPKNTEFEAIVTLQGSDAGNFVQSVTPTSEIITVRTHHSFINLPDKPYKIREFNPRSGGLYISYEDYAAPLGSDMTKKMTKRHRLEKKNPESAVSDPIRPIIYYLDPGTPEPIRSALLDGARWWAQGFDAAGFSNAFKVELLPKDADALDVRYNTIQWVHRSTRGWSYGDSIVDPRSGEILKGHVTLGSLRVRQDMLIAQGLLSPFKDGIESDNRIQEMALARLRQLSAHEVGHTLGFVHNFSASANNRASVMDYPHPLVTLENAEIDLSNAYASGLGDWDHVALNYVYGEFNQNETEELNKILTEANQKGLYLIADYDARNKAGSHPTAHLWDNGDDPVQSLKDVLAIRQTALNNFGINTIKDGESLFKLEQILTPIYLFHRYQTEAVSKLIAGVDYKYAIKGDTNIENRLVSGIQQKYALDSLMLTLHADQLAIPESILRLLLPPPEGSYRNREHFKSRTGLNFDALGAADIAARDTLKHILNPQRANRLTEHHARDKSIPNLETVIDVIIKNTWSKKWKNRYFTEVQNSINAATLEELMKLAANENASLLTQAITKQKLIELSQTLKKQKSALAKQSERNIQRFIKEGKVLSTHKPLNSPPGSPIGMGN